MPVPVSSPETEPLFQEAVALLQGLIRRPSFSKDEGATADLIEQTMQKWGLLTGRTGNNVWARSAGYQSDRPTLLLNSHHDTVRPNAGYTRDPFDGKIEDGRLYGLGSNDAGASLVSLLAVFRHLHKKKLPVNLLFAATAEEEISGQGGIVQVLPSIPKPHLAIVGEPTGMRAAVAEKGLLVLDCVAHGRSGHAARGEGENALYKALDDIHWFRSYHFPDVSDTLGEMRMTATAIEGGKQHNVVPDKVKFTVDVRVTDRYTHEQVLAVVRDNVRSEVTPRSMRLRSSFTPKDHPVYAAALALGMEPYGSPTLSDQALIPFPSVKIGPGDSARSHAPDEFIYLDEIRAAIPRYIDLIERTYPVQ